MATKVMDKKFFLTWLEKQIDDNEIILFSQDLTGEASVSKKRNEKKVSFAFAADAFKNKDTIGDIVFGKIPIFSIAVCKEEQLSEDTINLIKK